MSAQRNAGLLLIFTSKLGIISLKQRQHIGNLRQIYLYKGNPVSDRAYINNNPSSPERS